MKKALLGLQFAVLAYISFACDASLLPTEAPPTATLFPIAFPSSTPARIPSPPFTPVVMQSPTAAPSAAALAVAQTQAAQNYRVAMTLSIKQGAAPASVIDLKGDVDGADVSYSYQLSNAQIDYVAVHGQSYIRGARNLTLPSMTKWYSVTPDLADAARPPFDPSELLDGFASQAAALTFVASARESLDGQSCQVWRYEPKSTTETGLGDVLGADQDGSLFGTLEQGEIKLWACEDGLFHQLSVDLAAHNSKQAADKGTMKWLLHIWDVGNAAIKIDAPSSAEPFQLAVPTR
jgi:hypothetical protein